MHMRFQYITICVDVFPLTHLRAEVGRYTSDVNFYILKYFSLRKIRPCLIMDIL